MESLKIKVDVKRRTTENINLQQGYTYPIELTILDNGKEYDCTGATPQIHFAKSNGTFSIKTKDITIEGNKISFILDSEATNRSGTGKLQAVLTRNGFTFGSWAIFCNIFENVIQDGATEDKNAIDILTELKDEVTKAKPLADSLNANIPKAQPLVNSLNTQIPQATEIAREIESIIEEGGAVDKRELGEYKKDFEGVEHDTLNLRLNRDFDNLHQRMNESSLLAYEGTSIKADNTYLGLTKDTVIKGRTLQNVFDYTKVVSCRGLSCDNGIFSSNKVSWDYSFIVSDVVLKPSTEYTVFIDYNKNTYTGTPEFRSTITSSLLICPSTFQMETSEVYKYKTTTPSEINLNTSLIHLKGDDPSSTEGNFSFQLMILEGDHTQTPIEELPFIEGIESTGDKTRNLFDGQIEEGTFSSTGELLSSPLYIRSVNFIKVKPNTQYVVSYKNSDTRLGIYEYDINKNFIKVLFDGNPKLFTTSGTTQYLKFRVEKNTTNIQLEEGTQATPYQEYYDGYKISGKSIGKNLVTGVTKPNTSNLGVYLARPIKKGESFQFSFKPEGITFTHFSIYCENSKTGISDYYGISLSTFNGIFTALNDYDFIRIYCTHNPEPENVKDLMVAITPTLLPYEPYKDSNYSYILNEPLRSLPNGVCDTIDLATGVLTRRVGKTNVDSKKMIATKTVSSTGYYRWSQNLPNSKNKGYCICEKLSYIEPLYTWGPSYKDGISINSNDNAELLIYVDRYKAGVDKVSEFFEEFNGMEVFYELKTPTVEQLTPQQLKSFDTTTHIISDNKLMPIVSTKIPSDVNAVVQNLKTENVKLEKQLDSAIEELNNTDIDLMAIDWETDYRLCELEWTLLDTMKVETLAESKVVENRILSRYEQAKILIESGKYNKSTMEKQLTMYYNRNYLTKEEFNELMQLMNPIGEVETLEELDKVENI